MLLMSVRFIFLTVLSVQVASGVWYFLSCHNEVDFHVEFDNLLEHDEHEETCKRETWGNHRGE